MKSSNFSPSKQYSSKSQKTSMKSSKTNSQNSTPIKISPKNPNSNSQANSPKATSKNSRISSQSASPSFKSSPNAKEIQKLRLKHKSAINNLDFAEAESIEKQISELKSGTLSDHFSRIKSNFEKNINSIIMEYKKKLIAFKDDNESSINNFRIQINDTFDNLKSKQMEEMIELERVYATDRLKETQRSSPQYENMLLQAKSAGAVHDYQTALYLQNSALLVQQSILDKRLEQIDKDYEIKNEALLQKHTKEIILLVKRLEEGIKKINDKNGPFYDFEKKKLDAQLINEYSKTSKEMQIYSSDISPYLPEIDQILFNELTNNEIEIPKMLCVSVKNSTRSPLVYLQNSPK